MDNLKPINDQKTDFDHSEKEQFLLKYFQLKKMSFESKGTTKDTETDPDVFVEVSRTISKKQLEIYKEAKDSKKDKATDKETVDHNELFIFADQSYSMSGAPFEAVKMGCLSLSDSIFGQTVEDNSFKKVHLVFYDSSIYASTHYNK